MLQKQQIPVIAIDGPSASGKGSVAQLVADKLGFHYLDSGALYRVIALACLQQGVDWKLSEAVTTLAKSLNIAFNQNEVLLDNQNVEALIRSEEIGKGASQVAVHADLRSALVDLQRDFCKPPGLVADGRDMGSIIFLDAKLKIFLTANTDVRAQRRYQQLHAKNQAADYQAILQDLLARDARDQGRVSAPLKMAQDAILLNTDHLGIHEAVAFILQAFEAKK
jgi:CMP/dCMP kinase